MDTNQHSNLPTVEVIRDFLLGRLNAAQQEEFEARLMTDDRLEELVRQTEFQLADDFASERVERADRQRFAENFLLTDERRQIVAVSDALHKLFGPVPAASSRRRMSWREVFNRPALRLAFGMIAALLLVASFFVVTKEPQLVRRFWPRRAPATPTPISTPVETHHPANPAPPVHRQSESAPQEHESTPPNQTLNVVVTVSPSADLNQAPTIALPNGRTGAIRCQLTLRQTEAGEFQAELWTLNQSVFVIDSVKPNANQLNVDVPVRVLTSGDYEVRVNRLHDGSRQPVATYYFRIQ